MPDERMDVVLCVELMKKDVLPANCPQAGVPCWMDTTLTRLLWLENGNTTR